MAIDTVLPVSGSLITHGEVISFIVDDTYTSLIIQVIASASTESAYNTASGGAQAGYTITVINAAGRDTFTITRDLGWDVSPQVLKVIENETGTSATTSISFTLVGQSPFPQATEPYNPVNTGTLQVTEDSTIVRTDVGIIEFVGSKFNITDLGNGKIRVDLV